MTMHLIPKQQENHHSSRLVIGEDQVLSDDRGIRVGIVSSFPPTRCGIATYAASLKAALTSHEGISVEARVARVVQEGDGMDTVDDVVVDVVPQSRDSIMEAAAVLSAMDAVIIQHEFGIYGPEDGWAAVELVEALDTPLIITLHTVLEHPNPRQRLILRRLVQGSDSTVVLSSVARDLLASVYRLDIGKVSVIPHGADLGRLPSPISRIENPAGQPLLLTWGLIGPGKGLEWAIRAVDILRKRHPEVRYLVAGETHPKVAAREGESYRESLESLIAGLGVEAHVTMIDRYLDTVELSELLGRASAVILPYESTEQTSSGVLVEAVNAGVPVVATAFPHAVELERLGAVRTVPHRHPEALALAIDHILSDRSEVAFMLAAQQEMACVTAWRTVGERYLKLLRDHVKDHMRGARR